MKDVGRFVSLLPNITEQASSLDPKQVKHECLLKVNASSFPFLLITFIIQFYTTNNHNSLSVSLSITDASGQRIMYS